MNRNEINSRLKTQDIKGKPYIPVTQRVLAFWELFPTGAIITEKLSDDGKRCDFKASVYIDGHVVSTGHAYEYQGGGMVNKTSYVENCETSAIGRALGILGIGSTESIASADEVARAIEQQESPLEAAPKPEYQGVKGAKQRLWKAIQNYAAATGKDANAIVSEEKEREDYRDTEAYLYNRARIYESMILDIQQEQQLYDRSQEGE